MPFDLTTEQLSALSVLEREFGHRRISEENFRTQMLKLGFQDWEIDEYVDDLEADEP